MIPLLSVEYITRTYTRGGILNRVEFAAVDDVSFSLESDCPEIFAIIGESGSGKTTLARMILHTEAPSRGVIRFLGTDISRLRKRRGACSSCRRYSQSFRIPLRPSIL